jgi:hypothetical protein
MGVAQLGKSADRLLPDLLASIEQGVEFEGRRDATIQGALLGGFRVPEEDESQIEAIPSMAVLPEKRFLRNFFASFELGDDVIEFGPYLGGTTRAIALGLSTNPRFSSMFYSVDSFRWRAPRHLALLNEHLDLLVKTNSVSQNAVDQARAGSWLDLFVELHEQHPRYGHLVNAVAYQFPEGPGVVLPAELVAVESFSAVFVDGFKSWRATVSTMRQIVERLHPGSFLIFQDFSWYDCFWIPVLAAWFSEHLELVFKVVNTAAFRVTKSIGLETFDSFPATQDLLGADNIAPFLENWAVFSLNVGDENGAAGHSMQMFSMYSALGRYDEAARVLDGMRAAPALRGHRWLFDLAEKQPVQHGAA